jgi:hypothetical protein
VHRQNGQMRSRSRIPGAEAWPTTAAPEPVAVPVPALLRPRRRLRRAHLSPERHGQPKAMVAPTSHDTFWKQEFRGLIRVA